MILSEEDQKLYYKLWMDLLAYVNQKYSIYSDYQIKSVARNLDAVKVKRIADLLWEDVAVIDEYLSVQGEDIEEDHKLIISGWKRRIKGEFILERHLKKGSIFICLDNEEVYQVSGIISSWEEMFGYRPLPVVLKATLMPFKDVIISDGLIIPYDIIVGPNMAKGVKDTYMEAKKNGMIHTSL